MKRKVFQSSDTGGKSAERLHLLSVNELRLRHRELTLLLPGKLIDLHVGREQTALPLLDEHRTHEDTSTPTETGRIRFEIHR